MVAADPAVYHNLYLIFEPMCEATALAALHMALLSNPDYSLSLEKLEKIATTVELPKKSLRIGSHETLSQDSHATIYTVLRSKNWDEDKVKKLAVNYYKEKKYLQSAALFSLLFHAFDRSQYSYLSNYALCFQSIGNVEEATRVYERLLDGGHANTSVLNNFSVLLMTRNHFLRAVNVIEQATLIDKKSPELWNTKGNILSRLNKTDEAIRCYRKAISMDPSKFPYHVNLGNELIASGDFIESKKIFDKIISDDQATADNFYSYLSLIEKPLNSRLLKRVHDKLSSESSVRSKATFNFLLAKSFELENKFPVALNYYRKANELRRSVIDFSLAEYLRRIDVCLKPNCSSDSFDSNLAPVFLAGIPRSGTSLLEQILSMDDTISTLGELTFIEDYFDKFTVAELGKFRNHSILQSKYNHFIKKVYDPKKIFVDKMPLNYRYSKILLEAFPNSKLIFTKREKYSLIWSVYTTNFASTGNGFAYSIEEIYQVCEHYFSYIQKIKRSFPERVFIYEYELLIASPENYLKKLANFLNLEWSDAWLSFHQSPKSVNTASGTTIREGLVKNRNQRWRPYESYLKKCLRELKLN